LIKLITELINNFLSSPKVTKICSQNVQHSKPRGSSEYSINVEHFQRIQLLIIIIPTIISHSFKYIKIKANK